MPADKQPQPDRGAQVETAKISATIVRPAILHGGTLVSNGSTGQPRSQVVHGDGSVTYLFE